MSLLKCKKAAMQYSFHISNLWQFGTKSCFNWCIPLFASKLPTGKQKNSRLFLTHVLSSILEVSSTPLLPYSQPSRRNWHESWSVTWRAMNNKHINYNMSFYKAEYFRAKTKQLVEKWLVCLSNNFTILFKW